MRAYIIKELNHPSRIPLSHDVPEPKAGANEVLVDVYSAGLNFFDVWAAKFPTLFATTYATYITYLQILQAQGKYQNKPPLPFILGTEFAGRIAQDSPIPKGSNLKRGQRVFGAQLGSFSEKIAVHFDRVVPLPDNISYDQGAGE